MNLARTSLIVFAQKGINSVLNFFALALFANLLGSAEIGIFFLFQALVSALHIPADLGVRDAVQKRISEGESPDKIFTAGLLMKFALLMVVTLAIILFKSKIDRYISADLSLYLIVALWLQEIGFTIMSTLAGELRVAETAPLELARKIVWVGAGALFIFSGLGAEGLVTAFIIGYAVMIGFGVARIQTGVGLPSRDDYYSIFRYSRYAAVSTFGGPIYSWMDVLIIGYFLSSNFVGAYEMAWRISLLALLMTEAISATIFPKISELHAQGNLASVESIIENSISVVSFYTIPAFFGAVVLSEDILVRLLGPEFEIAWLVLIILMFEKIFQGILNVTGRSLQAIDKPGPAAIATIAAAVVNIGLNVVLISQFGIEGAAIATAISVIVNTHLHTSFLSRYVNVRLPMRNLAIYTFSSLIMISGLVALRQTVEIDSILGVTLVIGAGAISYHTVVLAFPDTRRNVYRSIKSII